LKQHGCPRCGSTFDVDERFCWFCGWDMRKEVEVCDRCGIIGERGQQCEICKSDAVAGWVDPEASSDEY
jgi:RNA polymerase subunit RPABC4/transcription elongation factor Spt4